MARHAAPSSRWTARLPILPSRTGSRTRTTSPAQIVLRQLTTGAPQPGPAGATSCASATAPTTSPPAVLDRLTEVGLVDDEAFAEMLVRSQQAGRGLARRALARELRSKGIDPELAAETLDGIDDESERERARELVAKKLRSMHGLDAPSVQTRRLAGMLARKGYASHDVVRGDPRGDRRRSRAPA